MTSESIESNRTKKTLGGFNRLKSTMLSGPTMLRQNRTVPRTRRVPIVDSDGEDEPTTFPDNSSSPLKSPNLRSHTISSDITKPATSTNTRIRQWRKLISREAYLFKPDAIPATYPEEWLHEKLPRLRSPLPSTGFVALSWMTTTASARAKMNITAADNMEMVAQGFRNSSLEHLFCEEFGDLQEHWREELRQSVLRKKALYSQRLLQPSSSQNLAQDFNRTTKQEEEDVSFK